MQTILDLCQGLLEKTYAAGEIMLTEGTRTETLLILIEGEVEILKSNFQVHTTAEPGAVFGEISALLGIPHTATVRTLTPLRAYAVADAGDFLKSHQEFAYFLCRLLAHRLHIVTGYLADLRAQFGDRKDHLGMVDEVLETLLHHQDEAFLPGSDRHPDPKI